MSSLSIIEASPTVGKNLSYLRSIFGNDVVFLPIPKGMKCPLFPGWQKLTLQDIKTPKFALPSVPKKDSFFPPKPRYYSVEIEAGNVGILQGTISGCLVSVDIDDDSDVQPFIDLNPDLADTLQTSGNRGRNFWFRTPLTTDPIKSFDLYKGDVKAYEFRADGRQTVVFGVHPSGTPYKILNPGAPIKTITNLSFPPDLNSKEVSAKDEILKSLPLMASARLAKRRQICENILGPIEWVSATQGMVDACPNAALHTSPTKLGDTWIFADGVPTLHCFHTSCGAANSAVNELLRTTIYEAERLVLPDGVITRDQLAETLFKRIADEQSLFCRSGQLVVEVLEKPTKYGDIDVSISPINEFAAVSRFENFGQFVQKKIVQTPNKAGGVTTSTVYAPKKILPSDAKELLSTAAARNILPPLDTVLSCPILTRASSGDSEILSSGYYRNRCTYVIYNKFLVEVPVQEAVDALLDLCVDYRFLTDADRGRFISSILTPALVAGGHVADFQVPLFVIDADKRGAGKTELARSVSKIYNSVPYLVAKKAGGVGSWDESLNTGLARGETFLLIDNLRGKLDSQFLESFITSKEKTPVRVPGAAEVVVDARNVILFATSNGFSATTDLSDRSVFINILKQPAGYIFETPLVTKIHQRQEYYLSCVFAIVSDWIKKGCQKADTAPHRMACWGRIIDYIVREYFGFANSIFTGHVQYQAVASNAKLSWALALSHLVEQEDLLEKELRSSAIAELCCSDNQYPPGMNYSLRGDIAGMAKQIGMTLKSIFKDAEYAVLGGARVRRVSKCGNEGKYYVYIFEKNTYTNEDENTDIEPEIEKETYSIDEREDLSESTNSNLAISFGEDENIPF